MPDLGTFDDRDVLNTTIKVTNAGDGLSQALAIDPVVMHHGEVVYVVLETTVDKVTHTIIKDTDCLSRQHTLKAGTATIVPADVVKAMIDAQAEKIRVARLAAERAKDEAAGKISLPGTDPRPTLDDGFYDPADMSDEAIAHRDEQAARAAAEAQGAPSLKSITGGRAKKGTAKKAAAPRKPRGT